MCGLPDDNDLWGAETCCRCNVLITELHGGTVRLVGDNKVRYEWLTVLSECVIRDGRNV
jgi:hypothetical protein